VHRLERQGFGKIRPQQFSPAPRRSRNAAVIRACLLTTVLLALVTLFVFSPLVQVRTVVWTGRVTLADQRYAQFESTVLGRSLWLLSEKRLSWLLAEDPSVFALEFRRHPPHTLEVCIQPRAAVARLSDGAVIDPEGRVIVGVPFEDLPLLSGIAAPREGRVDDTTRALLRALHDSLPTAAVRLSHIERQAEGWMLTLSDGGTRVRLSQEAVPVQLEKLRVYEQSLAQGDMPATIDLRWRDQIILQGQPGGSRDVQG
jgi:cell division septal protein FtsQ